MNPLSLWSHTVRVVGIPLALVCFGAPASVYGQTSLQIPIQFDFINPGAKSLALGGAFAGLADDSTATFANPAGLTYLLGSELSFELKARRSVSPFLERGRLSGTIIDQGVDTVQGPVFEDSIGTDFGLGYLSGVYVHPSFRWVLAGYRHELARIDETFFSQGVFQQDPTEFTSRRDSPQNGARKVSITGYGAAGAYKLRPDVSIGASLAVYSFDIDSVFRRFDINGFLGPPNLSVEFGRSSQQGSDLGFAPTVGLTIDRGRTRVGIVYRRGASFEFETQDGDDPLRTVPFRVPHTFGVGASVRATPQLLVSAEVSHIGYSRLVEDFVVDQARATGQQNSFFIDDGTEVHVSAQYALLRDGGSPIRLRIGTWFDPDHSVRFEPARMPLTPSDRLFDERLAAALSQGGNQVHVTGGVGFTINPRLELNVGFDAASRQRLLSTSFIVHLQEGP